MPPPKPPEIVAVAKTLNEFGVDWVLVGGMAMVLHGSSYVTADIDIGIAFGEDNAERVANALQRLSAKPRRWDGRGTYEVDPRLLTAPFLEFESEAGFIHLLKRFPGLSGYAELKNDAVEFPINGTSVLVASLDSLILMKSASERPKDRAHLLELEALRKLEA